MGFLKKLALMCAVLMATLQVSVSVVYKVGDSSGWTTTGNVDYKQWAASKTFNIGDTIVFEYNAEFHNVVQVNHQDYTTCNVPVTPLAAYSTGNDSITIKRYGHYFFACGAPGHCKAGQKVDIRVSHSHPKAHSPAPSPSPSSSAAMAPATRHTNRASLPSESLVAQIVLLLVMFTALANFVV